MRDVGLRRTALHLTSCAKQPIDIRLGSMETPLLILTDMACTLYNVAFGVRTHQSLGNILFFFVSFSSIRRASLLSKEFVSLQNRRLTKVQCK